MQYCIIQSSDKKFWVDFIDWLNKQPNRTNDSMIRIYNENPDPNSEMLIQQSANNIKQSGEFNDKLSRT